MKTKDATKLKAGDVVRLPGSERWATVRSASLADGLLSVGYTFDGDPLETNHRYRCTAASAPKVEVKPTGGEK